MNMFSNFTNSTTQYNPNTFQPQFPNAPVNPQLQEVKTNKPYELKSPMGDIIGYFWYYGNSVDLVFNLTGEITLFESDRYITIDQLIDSLTFIGSVYDFRHVKILEFSNIVGAENKLIINNIIDKTTNKVDGSTVTMSITSELSSLLVKGKYYIELIATHPATGYCETLFSASDTCTFEVR